MLLAFDVGNSNIKIGLIKLLSPASKQQTKAKVIAKIRISSQLNRTADEYYLFLNHFISAQNLQWSDLTGVVISSVVPIITGELNICIETLVKLPCLVLNTGVKTGLKISTEQPQELGSDLVANAVGAYSITQKGCIAVAFGTATTFTCISDSGELLGVAIAPGIETALKSLVKNTALLRQVNLEMPQQAIGRNTQEAIRAGLILGNLGAVEYILQRQQVQMLEKQHCQEKPLVLTTGFFGKSYQKYSNALGSYEENLLLYGLAEIWKRNN